MPRYDSGSASWTGAGMASSVAPELLRIIADPDDHGPLTLITDRPIPVLRNARTGREYPIVDGIPRLHQAASVAAHAR